MKTRTMHALLLAMLIILFTVPGLAQEVTPDAVIPVEVVKESPDTLLSLTVGDVLSIVLSVAGIAIGIGIILWNAGRNPNGQNVDAQITEVVDSAHADRERMAAMERAYQVGTAAQKTALDATVSVLQAIAPLTPLKADDAALSLLKDVQTPGVMAQAAATTGTGYTITGNQDGVTITADTSPTPFAVTTSGTPIPSSQTPSANLTNLHDMAGGAQSGGAEGFHE